MGGRPPIATPSNGTKERGSRTTSRRRSPWPCHQSLSSSHGCGALPARSKRPLTGSAVARLADASQGGADPVLQRLVAHGLVRSERQGASVLLHHQQGDVAWPAIELLANLRSQLLALLRGHVAAWPEEAVSVLLFGSFARGDATADSDVATGSYSGVRKVLHQLVEHGVVEEVPGGFRLNRDHLAADAIVQLASLHRLLAERLRQWAASHDGVEFVGLFGSVARRDGDATSDIDVLVIADLPAEGRSVLRDELSDLLTRWTGNNGHVLVLDRGDVTRLVDEQAPIVESWSDELQTVVGDAPSLGQEVAQ